MNLAAKEPEPKRGPNVRVKPFGYFGAFAKVTRRQGGTLGGRYSSNGYVHEKENGRLSDRVRWQASSHRDSADAKKPRQP